MQILILETPVLVVYQMLGFDRLSHHSGNQAETLEFQLVVAIGLEAQIHSQRADCLSLHDHGNTDVRDFLFLEIALSGSIQEHRLEADLWHDNGLAGPDNPARDSLAEPVPGESSRIAQPGRCLDPNLLTFDI